MNAKFPEEEWKKAKTKCGLDDEEVWMAQKLRITPAKAIAMTPDRKERWKDSVPLRIRRLFDKHFGKRSGM